ncbi:protein FAM114A2-like isoform X2 [Pecten maximus]|uniref:protein FAM114A2-like isoform X1 n=1 Tax=Pecten maximus TaxID=6579 RepID=UPI00145806AB|nr:protein FAM114A2-like isoform X1 [Pecten maximus]XP_033743307.1 protein FAM114A2-like isoform X1 [Pecten maximus]XP_033743308.1 protein FAM114A2-like isoform X2 [Pecten maximus]
MSDSEDEFASADEGGGLSEDTKSTQGKVKRSHSTTKSDKSDARTSGTCVKETESKKGATSKDSQKKNKQKNVNKNKTDVGKQETGSTKSTDKKKKTNIADKSQAPKSNTEVKGSGSSTKEKKKQSEDSTVSLSSGNHKKEKSDKHEDKSDKTESNSETPTQTSKSEETPGETIAHTPEEVATHRSRETTPQKEVNTETLKDTTTDTRQRTDNVSSKRSEELRTEAKQEEKKQSSASGGWSAWGNWGSSLMNVASHSVSTFTSQVEGGFNTLVDAVETSMGAPSAEELAEMKRKSREESEAPENTTIDRENSEHDDQEENKKSVTENKGDNPEDRQEEQAKGGWFQSLAGHVEDKFNTLVDAVETSMGAPSPEELAEMKRKSREESEAPENTTIDRENQEEVDQKEKGEKQEEKKKEDNVMNPEGGDQGSGSNWFSSWGMSSLTSVVQNTTHMVQNTSNALVTGSLDVLETIGKKTFDVIKDHDPGLHKTKEVLFQRGDKPNLSQILRDAKEDSAKRMEQEKESDDARKAHFGFMFDEYQGLAHLEALEILANQCEKKVQTLLTSMPADTLADIKSDLIMIKQVFERNEEDDDDEDPEDQDFVKLVTDNLANLSLGTDPGKLNRTQDKIRQSISKFCTKEEGEEEQAQPKAVHQVAIQSLAELTSKSVEQFHKAGELILLNQPSDKQCLDRATSLSNLTNVLCTEVGIMSVKFTSVLNTLAEGEEDSSDINTLVTNIYLEAGNSSTYIQDAFQLLLPCLQEVTIQAALQ